MEIRIVDRTGQMNDLLKESLIRDIHFALSRFANEIRFVTAKAEDMNGPRGGVDKRCTLRAATQRHGTVEVSQECFQLGSGLARAARRLGYTISRRLKANRDFGRESIRRREALPSAS